MAIQEIYYTTPNGTKISQTEALQEYGSEYFDQLVNEGQLVEFIQEEEADLNQGGSFYEAPNGNVYTEGDLMKELGEDEFQELILDGQLKKKDSPQKVSRFGGGDLEPTETLPYQDLPELTEQDFFEGGFGDALRGFDSIVPLGIGDFIDDMTRAVAGGINQGIAAENAADLLWSGRMSSDEDIATYIEANKNAQKYGASKEMQEYQRAYEENGKGILGIIMGLGKSGLTVVPELILSSFSTMAANSDALAAGGTVIAGGAAIGASTAAAGATFVVPGLGTAVGAAAGAITGAAASIPYAWGAASAALEMGATFSELLQEEIEGELTIEKIKAALSDEKTYISIRNKSVARGLIVGAIDTVSGKVGGTIASSTLKKGAAATGVASRATKLKALAKSSGVEAVGGSIGEVAGVVTTNVVGDTGDGYYGGGQGLDLSDIVLEGVSEVPGGVKNLISARFSKPKYKVNGEKVDAATIDSLIETMTLEEFSASKIQIDNDYEGRDFAMQDRIQTLSIEEQTRKIVPNISSESMTEVVALQKELFSLEGNKTEIAKRRASEIRALINDVVTNETVKAGTVEVTDEAVISRIKEINGDDYVFSQEEFDTTKKLIEAENKVVLEEVQQEQVVRSTEEFRKLEQSEQIDYLEKATKELAAEAETGGQVDFEITESQALTRANQLFQESKNEASKQERLGSRDKNLFEDENEFSVTVGGSNKKAIISDVSSPDEKGVVTAEYVNPDTGVVDVIISGVDEKNFVGYVRVYENGKPTNMFTAKMESTGDAFKNMITSSEAKLPDNAEVVETTSISIGGLKTYNKSNLVEKVGSDGNVVTRPTPYSDATKQSVEEKGQSAYNPFKTDDKAKAEAEVAKIETAYPGITATINERKGPPPPPPKIGEKAQPTTRKQVYSISIDLPVLVSPNATAATQTNESQTINQNQNEETQPTIAAGNRLFSKPLQAATEIANRIKKRIGINTPKGKRITELNLERAKRISDAYQNQQSNPDDPEVQEAYKALIEETIAQYEEIIADGYGMELSDTEYKNSTDMISDLRDNKNMRVFSTEEGFGTEGITDADRASNPMLNPTNFKDKNGKPLLVNDVFRFVHDFFGHSKEGNGFGPLGEENAWDVHSRMYTPKARRAMTTETRGQNSWVNFSGVNEAAFALRDEARALRKEGKFDEAEAKVKEAYALMKFADQKVMLLPEEFSQLDSEASPDSVLEDTSESSKKKPKSKAKPKPKSKAKPKPKPKAKPKILSSIKSDTDVTAENKITIASNLKALTKGVKTAVVSWMRTSKFLAQEIDSMVKSGRITLKQSAAILKKFSGVNMFNEASIDRFVDFMARVINNAEYAEQLSTVRKNIKQAKKNIRAKIGSADAVAPILSQVFDVNPSLIPESVWKIYTDLVADFAGSGAVISPSNVESVSLIAGDIIDSLNAEFSQTEELGQRFDAFDKVLDNKTGKVDYAATIKKMEKEGVITSEELSIMSKYRTEISPASPKTPKTKAEIQAEKDAIIEAIKGSPTLKISEISNKLDRAVADRFVSLMATPEVLESMSLKDLQQIQKLMDNINNGYLPHLAQIQVEKMSSVLNSNILTSAIQGSKLLPVSALYGRLKSLVTKRGAISEMIRRNPLFYIDQIFGDFKTKDIFNSVFNQSAIAHERYQAEIKTIFGRIDKAESNVAKTYKRNPNGLMMSKFKQMIYSVQLEAESNPGNPEVNQAGAYIKKTIEAIMDGKTTFTKRDADMLNEIYNKFQANGDIDINKLYDSFSKVEKASIKEIQDINIELQEKAVFTSAVIRGDRINPRNNYTHLNVITAAGKDNLAAPSEAQKILQSLRPSTRANSLIERTGNVAPLNFDFYASASRGAKGVLLDFHMTEPIRTTHRTLDRTKEALKGDSNMMPGNQREKFNAIRDSFDEVIGNLYVNAFTQNGIGDSILKFMNKNGYRAILASSTRWVAELTSNTAFALITNPKAFTIGAKIGLGFLNSDAAPTTMRVLGSKQTTRIYPSHSLSGRMIDTNLMNQAQGEKGGRVKGRFKNKMTQVWNLTGAKYAGSVASVSDALISTPDKIVMRPMWFGSFSTEFQKLTGQKPDFDKIASEDSTYLAEYSTALKDATVKADETSVMTGSTSNPFMGILKGQSKPEDGLMTKAFNNFNTFMTTFLIYEYVTARTGIVNAVGNGNLSKTKGAQLIAGSATRMITYTMLATVLSEALTGLAGDEPEEKKSPEKQLGQALASTFSSMLLGRDFGNATKSVINYGIEEFNKEFLDFLREGEYNSFKDGIQYQIVPNNKDGRGSDIGDYAKYLSAGYSPFIKTIDFMITKATEAPKVTEEARKRQQDEVMIRLPLEVLGNTGLIPLYKDVRKLVLRNMYKEMRRATFESAKRKSKEVDKLQGYDSRSDMKKYDYRLWVDTFGPNSLDWDDEERIREEKKQLRDVKTKIKDEENGYTGKGTKSGFGTSKFNSGKERGLKRKTEKKGGSKNKFESK